MKAKSVATTLVVAALATAQAAPVRADMGDAIAGAIVGGLIGGAIVKNEQKRKAAASANHSRPKAAAKPAVSSAQREANREVQTALNYFGYNVGTPDGAIGPKSRSAIAAYQATLGYPPSGQLTDYERSILVTSYHRAVAGGPAVSQVVATHPMGMKGLLLVQRDEMAGIPAQTAAQTAAQAGQMAAAAAGMAAGVAAAPALPALVAEPAPVVPAAPALPQLPSFGGATMVSLSSHCNQVALKTNQNGGYATLATLADPGQALSEQFCLTRAVAIQQGEQLAANVPGVTPQQVAEQCRAFGPVLKDHVNAVSLKPADDVLAGVAAFAASSGQSPAQLSGTSKICLGAGYAMDDMDVALGSALVLTALGETGYAELAGHHLAEGIGATRRPDLAQGWYDKALAAPVPVVTGMAPDRGEMIRKAVFLLNGRSEAPAVAPPPALPVLAPAPAAPEVVVAAPAPDPVPEAAPALPVQAEAAPAPQAGQGAPITAAQAVSFATALPRLMLGN